MKLLMVVVVADGKQDKMVVQVVVGQDMLVIFQVALKQEVFHQVLVIVK